MKNRMFYVHAGCAAILALGATIAWADTNSTPPVASNELPKTHALLTLAASYEAGADNPENAWRAAIGYCEASRLGSIEAQYRLGMLYAFGKGVPANKTLAAALFSLASNQGHAEAQNMLETINLTSSDLPACVTSEVLPERPPQFVYETKSEPTNIERQLAILPDTKRWIIELVDTLSAWYNIDPKLVLAIITVESNFEVKAQSPKAAMGLMQLIPGTAERFNIKNAFDATQNIKGGIRYLRWLLSYYHGNITLVAAAYNAGERAVDRHRGVPPYPETKQYVQRVLKLYQRQEHPYDEKITVPSPIITRPG
jgi:soluble lytic murein transglycosylase-like protein